MSDDENNAHQQDLVDALPGLARVAAGIWLRTAIWGVETSLRIGNRFVQAAISPEAASSIRAGMRDYARELLGITDLDQRVRQLMPGTDGDPAPALRARPDHAGRPLDLREAGAALLRQSADVNRDDDAHPAFARILAELHPDEARILRLLITQGPQPCVDVRAANLIGVGSQLIAQGLNMLGAETGCRHVDRVPVYLNNLNRLGLIWFSHDPIDEPARYQVLEAQPDTMAAIKRAGRARTVHRSIALTAFGKDFCDVCLPRDVTELDALAAD